MLRFYWILLSIFLILIIILQVPPEIAGLSKFSFGKTNPLNLSERIFNILTAFFILIYFGMAINFNLT